MWGLEPEVLALFATAITTAVMQYTIARTDMHRTEAHELRDRVRDLEEELGQSQAERDKWREAYFDQREKGVNHDAE